MINEKEKNEKRTVDKILPLITLILSVTTLIQLLISISQYLNEVNPTFWEKFFLWMPITMFSVGAVSLLILGILSFIIWLRNKDKWKNRKKISKEFDQEIRDEIKYGELEIIANELRNVLPDFLDAEIEGVNSFYWHMGLEISIWKPITKEGKFELSEDDKELFTNLFLCKFSKKDKRTVEILGSPHITEWIAKDIQMLSAEIRMWEKLLWCCPYV